MSGPDSLDGLPQRPPTSARTLGWVAVLEVVTLTILLVNLVVDGSHAVAQAVGPVAGSFFAYYVLKRK